jgi:hypothetical protein
MKGEEKKGKKKERNSKAGEPSSPTLDWSKKGMQQQRTSGRRRAEGEQQERGRRKERAARNFTCH